MSFLAGILACGPLGKAAAGTLAFVHGTAMPRAPAGPVPRRVRPHRSLAMKTLQHYVQPSPLALRGLQDALGYSNTQMAQLAGLDDAAAWQAFTAPSTVHRLGKQRVFYMAARLALEPAQWRAVLARMRTIGARFDDHDDALPPPLTGAYARRGAGRA